MRNRLQVQSQRDPSLIFSSLEPLIVLCLPYTLSPDSMQEARHKIIEILRRVLSDHPDFEDTADLIAWVYEALPLIRSTQGNNIPDCFSILLLCPSLKHLSGEDLFLEHIKYGLSPEKKPSLISFCHYLFHFEGISQPIFIAEARLFVEDQGLHYAIKSRLPSWSQELQFLLQHPTYTSDWMKIRHIALPDHLLPFFQSLVHLIGKFPLYIEPDIFQDLSCFLTHTNTQFRRQRSLKTLIRLLYSHYFLRKTLIRHLNHFQKRRHILLRSLHSQISFPFGVKTALGIAAALHLPYKYDYFDEHSLFLAVKEQFPQVQLLQGMSYFSDNHLRLLYIELEKADGMPFSYQERNRIIDHLKRAASSKIERLTPSIFIKRNEEEVMKNLIVLSRELNRKSDRPQVIIQLEKQTWEELFFTVILVRIQSSQNTPLQDWFLQNSSEVQYFPERLQIVGYLGKKWAKEAHVFQLRLKRHTFLRADSSTHFYLAREHIVGLLEKAVGPIRDYNGGFIFLQRDILTQLKARFPDVCIELVETFFYSITPIELQVVIPLELLISLFQKILKFIETVNKDGLSHHIFSSPDYTLALFRQEDPKLKQMIDHYLDAKSFHSQDYIHFSLLSDELTVGGYLCWGCVIEQHKDFASAIQQAWEVWVQKTKALRILRVNFQDWPYSLDPRLGGDTLSSTLLKLLYEGLTRKEKDGSLTLALAEKVSISYDLKTYTFKLHNTYWSNGDPLVAYDFEYAWKKILSPSFATPFAHLFYLIKNAQAAKEGRLPMDRVPITSTDPSTLIIELETPSSYFLELLLHPIFSPVHHRIDLQHPQWSSQEGVPYICNGPFHLHKASPQWGRYELLKNLHYWDINNIQLDGIHFFKANSRIALEMFLKNEIDWLGRPMCPWEVSFTQTKQPVETYNTPAVQWYVFNTQVFPFNNKKIRQAIAQTIDRKELSSFHDDAKSPSITPLPWAHTLHGHHAIPSPNPQLARDLFSQALQELGISHKEFPLLTLIHTKEEKRHRIAQTIKSQIEETLGIRCQTEAYSWDKHFDKMTKGEYQFGAMGWTALIDDPLYTLNIFRNRHERINFAKWEDAAYQ